MNWGNGMFETLINENNQQWTQSYHDGTLMCVQSSANPMIALLPVDLADSQDTNWNYVGRNMKNGVICDTWRKEVKNSPRHTSVYFFYYDSKNQVPVFFDLRGYNTVFMSHFDHYEITYYNFIPNHVDDGAWDLPKTCKNSTAVPSSSEPPNESAGQLNLMLMEMLHSPEDETAFVQWASEHTPAYHLTLNPRTETSSFTGVQLTSETVVAAAREWRKRLPIFTANKAFVDQHDAAQAGFSLKLNRWADLTHEEWTKRLGFRPSKSLRPQTKTAISSSSLRKDSTPCNPQATDLHASANPLPVTFDWRSKGAVNKVKDQESCGSCWSFGATGSLEGCYFVAFGNLLQLSEQQIMDCSWAYGGNSACYGGDSSQAFAYIHDIGGVMGEKDYPYLGYNGKCHPDATRFLAGVTSCVAVTPSNVTALQYSIFQHGPVEISIDASPITFRFYDQGVYRDSACSTTNLDHSVLAVGWGTERGVPYWEVKNSWSTMWGNNGYIRIARDANVCGVLDAPLYPIPAQIQKK